MVVAFVLGNVTVLRRSFASSGLPVTSTFEISSYLMKTTTNLARATTIIRRRPLLDAKNHLSPGNFTPYLNSLYTPLNSRMFRCSDHSRIKCRTLSLTIGFVVVLLPNSMHVSKKPLLNIISWKSGPQFFIKHSNAVNAKNCSLGCLD